MIKIVCDRCGKTIKDYERIRIDPYLLPPVIEDEFSWYYEPRDFCKECWIKIVDDAENYEEPKGETNG